MLVDGVFEHPALHRAVALTNEEGASDAVLFGASVSRVARAVPDRSFYFMGTGSPTGDPGAIAASPRWSRLQQGFRDAGVTFVVFMREGCAGEAEFIREADDIVVLAESRDAVPASVSAVATKVRSLVGPASDGTTSDGHESEVLTEPGEATYEELLDPLDDLSGREGDGVGSYGRHEGALEEAHAVQEQPVMDLSGEMPAGTQAAAPEAAEMEGGAGESENEHGGRAHQSEREPRAVGAGRAVQGAGADPNARKKLLWVALGVVVLVLIVVLGALRPE